MALTDNHDREASFPLASRLVVGIAAACVAFLLAAAPAGAHPSLLGSAPGPGLVARAAPLHVQLAFSEDIEPRGSSLTVKGPKGRVPTSALVAPDGSPGMRVRLQRKLGPGVYAVKWTVLGGDGHTVAGEYRFAVALPDGELPPGAASLAGTDPGGRGGESARGEGVLTVAMRWLSILAASLLLGAALLERRLRRGAADDESGVVGRRFARVRAWALALSALAAAELIAVTVTSGAAGHVQLDLLTASTTGSMALARLVVVLLAAVALVGLRGRLGGTTAAAAGVAILLTHSLDGHTAVVGDDRVLAGLVQSAHVLGAGLWSGGLLALAAIVALTPGRAARLEIARRAARALAPVAGAAALVVLASGIVAALREVDEWYFLRWSDYGRVVLAKLAAWLLLATAGATAFLLLRRGRPTVGRVLRAEALGMAGVLVLAAVLAGLVQGRGQPLPAQRGNLLAGPGFGNAAAGKALARVTLTPARRGVNELTAVVGPLDLGARSPRPERVRIRLSCRCARRSLDAGLVRSSEEAWRATVRLPAEGLWEARVVIDERASLAGLPLSVGDHGARGSAPLVAISTADLSGRDAQRCRSHELGLVLAVAGANARGGLDGGRKLVQRVYDDRGDPARAAELVRRADATALVAPCGAGADGALRAASGRMPAIVTDPSVPVVHGAGIYRTAPDGHAEGVAFGQLTRTGGFQAFPDAPRRVAVVAPYGATGDAVVRGVRESTANARVDVVPVRYRGEITADALAPAISGTRYISTYLDGEERAVASALKEIGRRDERIVPSAIFASARLFSERLQVDSGVLGRIGSLRAIGEVSPLTRESFGYSNLVRGLYQGERPTISGLRGFLAGRALIHGLGNGDGREDLVEGLRSAGRFSDALAAGWSPDAPASGTRLVGFFLPSFLPSGLIRRREGGQEFAGSYFSDGAWRALTNRLYGPRAIIRPGAAPRLHRSPDGVG